MRSGFYSPPRFPPLILILCFDLLLLIRYNGSAGSKSGLRSGTEPALSGPVKRAVAPAANSRAGLPHNGGFCCWRMCLRSNPWHWGRAQGPGPFCFIILLNVTVGSGALGQLEVAAGRPPQKRAAVICFVALLAGQKRLQSETGRQHRSLSCDPPPRTPRNIKKKK